MLIGHYRPIVANGDLLLFVREHETERILVGLNLGGDTIELVVSSTGDRNGTAVHGEITLRANEGVVMTLGPDVMVPRCIV